MRLVSLSLRNYRKYAEEQIDFPDGLVGIVGPNGVGKSTLMEAIAWALYGNPATRTTKEDIRRLGTSQVDICEVVLDIELAGHPYRVVREIRGKDLNSDAAVHTHKKCAARGTRASLEYVTKLLSMDREAFFTSFFAKQKELNALSDLQPAERKTLIIRMLGINNVDRALEILRADLRDHQTRITILRESLADITTLKTELKTKQEEAKKQTKLYQQKRQEEKTKQKELSKAKNTFVQQERKKEIHARLTRDYKITEKSIDDKYIRLQQLADEQKNIRTAKQQLEKLKPAVEQHQIIKEKLEILEKTKSEQVLAKELETRKQSLLKIVQENNKSLKTFRKTYAQLQSFKQNIAATEELLQKGEESKRLLDDQRAKIDAQLEQLKLDQAKLTNQKQDIQKRGPESKCPTCLRALGKDFPQITKHLEEEIEKYQAKIKKGIERRTKLNQTYSQVTQKIAELKKVHQDLQNQLNETKLIGEKIKILCQENNKAQKELNQIEEHLKQIKKAPYDEKLYNQLTKKLEDLSKKRDQALRLKAALERENKVNTQISQLQKEVALLEEKLLKIKEQGLELKFSQEEYEEAKQKLDATRQALHQAQLEAQEKKHVCDVLALAISNLKKEIDTYNQKQKEIKKLSQKKQNLDNLEQLFADFRKNLIGRIRPALSQKASNLLRELTDGKYLEIELDEDYEVYIYDQGQKFPIDRFSGGEKDLANLCLRLAISQLMSEASGSEFGFIILDEIFGSQDPIRKANIMHALQNLSNMFRQIFLITHVEDVKDTMEHIINVQEDESGLSHLSLE